MEFTNYQTASEYGSLTSLWIFYQRGPTPKRGISNAGLHVGVLTYS